MRIVLLLAGCLLAGVSGYTQLPDTQLPLQQDHLKSQMYFLASDHLAGRRTGSPGNTTAAHFIASHYAGYGLTSPEGADNYFQHIPFEAAGTPATARLTIGEQVFEQGENLLMISGGAVDMKGRIIFAGHGWVDAETDHDDYAELDVRDKVVVVLPGPPGNKNPQAIFEATSRKIALASERGAAGLVEIYQLPFPWTAFKNFFQGENLRVADTTNVRPDLPYGWLNPGKDNNIIRTLQADKKLKAALNSSGAEVRRLSSQNVIGVLEGSDPELKDEYLLITAHYDHVGVGSEGGGQYSEQDSIFNGARDNAFGTIALLSAARVLSENRPARSVIFLAVTAEEIGLLGSGYYADNPLIPLEQTIFNLNTDGAGYNVTDAVSVIGYGRTGTDDELDAALAEEGLRVIADPAPEQGLFDRSDNVNFARKGVPALTFSPAFENFDAEIMRYYHQVTDNPETIDFDYLYRFCRAFARTAHRIANAGELPRWIEGDKYEAAGKQLYDH